MNKENNIPEYRQPKEVPVIDPFELILKACHEREATIKGLDSLIKTKKVKENLIQTAEKIIRKYTSQIGYQIRYREYPEDHQTEWVIGISKDSLNEPSISYCVNNDNILRSISGLSETHLIGIIRSCYQQLIDYYDTKIKIKTKIAYWDTSILEKTDKDNHTYIPMRL